MSRWILADDTDFAIVYEGPWFADIGDLDAFGKLGPPYLSTLLGVKSPASFTYTFRGSRVRVTGTVQFLTVGNITNPSAQCILDGEMLPLSQNKETNNSVQICAKDGLDDNLRTITVNVDVSDDRTFWLDYIEYLPYPDTPIDTAAISIASTDDQIQLKNWTPIFRDP